MAAVRERLEKREHKEGGHSGAASSVATKFDAEYSAQRAGLKEALGSKDVEGALVVYRAMQGMLHDTAGLLPAWDRQRANEHLAQALRDIDSQRAAASAAKRRGFKFSRRRLACPSQVPRPSAPSSTPSGVETANVDRSDSAQISGKQGERIFVPPSPSMFLSDLRDCEVFIRPVDGSVFVERCEGCTLVIAARQLRVHNTKGCSFYLHCGSQPIIEDCADCGFAPFTWEWEGRDEVFASTTLAGHKNKWAQVNDFKWIRLQQSPNWHIIPEEGRRGWKGEAADAAA
eukprot:Hpha_TRINITY_DN27720_c0_g1::TRINITY_DN27720_c0_g1_i1::g.157161::m.157161